MINQSLQKPLYIEAVSLYGPGMPSWSEAKPLFSQPEVFCDETLAPMQSKFLVSGVKRRTTQHMHVAIYAAERALEEYDGDNENIELVFATSEGDLNIAHDICYALTLEDKPVSPQKFQNVILNAAVGHFGIITKNIASASSVTGATNSLAIGLLHSYASSMAEETPVLFVAYDAPSLLAINPNGEPLDPFSVGFIFRPYQTDKSIAAITMRQAEGRAMTRLANPLMERIATRTSSARALTLLSALANNESAEINLPYCENSVLTIEISPCQ